jgi:hypothetical protein
MSAANQIDYIEFQAADLDATKKFFEQLFQWKFTDYGPDYTSFHDGRMAGGFARAQKRSTIDSGGVLVVFYHPDLEVCASACSISLARSRKIFFRFQAGDDSISPNRAGTNAQLGRKSGEIRN